MLNNQKQIKTDYKENQNFNKTIQSAAHNNQKPTEYDY